MSLADTVQRVAMEVGVDPALADSIWAQESGRSSNTGLRGQTLSRGRGAAVGPFQVVPYYHPEFPVNGSFEDQARYALKYLKKVGPARYYGTGKAPEGHPTSQQYVDQVMRRAQGNAGGSPQISSQPASAPMQQSQQAGNGMDQRLLQALMMSQGQGQQAPVSKIEQALGNPLVQAGLNVMQAGGHGGDWAAGLGEGLQNTMYDMQAARAQQEELENERMKQMRLALGGTGAKDTRTANQKDFQGYQQMLAQADQLEAAGRTEEAAQLREMANKHWNQIMSQRNPEWHMDYKEAGKSGETLNDRIAEAESGLIRYQNIFDTTFRVERQLAEMEEIAASGSGGGWRQIFSFVKGSNPQRLRHLAEIVKNSIGLDSLKQLKAESSTGASGLGAVNQEELNMLKESVEKLDPNGDPEILREEIARTLTHYRNLRKSAEAGYAQNLAFYRANRGRATVPSEGRYSDKPKNPFEAFEKAKRDLQGTSSPSPTPGPAPGSRSDSFSVVR